MIDISNLQKNEVVTLPKLAVVVGLSDDVFLVDDILPGGMGVCVKLIHKTTGAPYALKAIQTQYVATNNLWARFIEELKWWLTLSECDGVAEAYCIERLNEIPCMCAAWQHNGSLRPYMGRCEPEFVYRIMSRVVNGAMLRFRRRKDGSYSNSPMPRESFHATAPTSSSHNRTVAT
jgi:hypothetical protein